MTWKIERHSDDELRRRFIGIRVRFRSGREGEAEEPVLLDPRGAPRHRRLRSPSPAAPPTDRTMSW
ncbi:hypothetical protein ACFQMH_14305 [Streptomyces viridiviolaceus]|uniref:Uncharacterized protein n=1 Tax=Streptomyces viridiviolaceus TaxID=68282 RepID=A0ABW2E236_9ACTN